MLVASDEYQKRVGIYDVSPTGAPIFRQTIPMQGSAPVGLAFVDPHTVLATVQTDARFPDDACPSGKGGVVVKIDTKAMSVVQTARAGCQPVRVAASGGGTVYVSSRSTNRVIIMDAASLAVKGQVEVGPAPVGLKHAAGNRLVVAASNRFGSSAGRIDIVGLDTGVVEKSLLALKFPRDVAVSPDGSLAVVANYNSSKLSVIDIPSVVAKK
jgi:YVTN family beta-propeller protein